MWQSLGADNILFTVAAGNCQWNMDNVDTFVFPASLRKSLSLNNMLVVSSASINGFIWSDPSEMGTTFGRPIGPQSIDIAITTDEGCVLTNDGTLTCTCGNDPGSFCAGTSFAAPAVAGVAALVLQAHPEFKSHPDLLQTKIDSTAKPSPATEAAGFPTPATAYISGGFVNALGAVQ
jgi:subtilisin family serine protease